MPNWKKVIVSGSNASLSSVFANNVTASVFSGSFTGSLQGTASFATTASYALNAKTVESITGAQYFIPVFNSTSSLITSSIYQSSSFTAIGATSSLHPNAIETFLVNSLTNSYNLISGHANIDEYVQLNIKNFSGGPSASADIVATADTGDEESNYINMGINSSGYTYNNAVGGALDAYLYNTGENLLIGNVTEGKQIIFFNGGFNVIENASLWIHDQGTISINTDQFNATNPPSLVVYAPNSTTNTLIEGVGESNQFLQLAISNQNSGSLASSDIVAYNNIDPTNQGFGFIDMGINSTNFNDPTNYPGWIAGHSYLYTDAPGMIIGSTSGSSQINMFVGGANPITNSKLLIKANNQHLLTGSLSATQGFTGSLLGTASFATTASFALNAGAGSGFPFSGSAVITGSLLVSGSGLTVTGSLSTLGTLDLNNARFNSTSSATTAGTTIVSSNATGSFNSAFYNYYISSGSNARAGQIMSVWSGSTIQYTEVTTNDIGNTNTASLAVTLATGNVRLSFTAPGVWTVRSIVNLL
jgi:hypothetical protein